MIEMTYDSQEEYDAAMNAEAEANAAAEAEAAAGEAAAQEAEHKTTAEDHARDISELIDTEYPDELRVAIAAALSWLDERTHVLENLDKATHIALMNLDKRIGEHTHGHMQAHTQAELLQRIEALEQCVRLLGREADKAQAGTAQPMTPELASIEHRLSKLSAKLAPKVVIDVEANDAQAGRQQPRTWQKWRDDAVKQQAAHPTEDGRQQACPHCKDGCDVLWKGDMGECQECGCISYRQEKAAQPSLIRTPHQDTAHDLNACRVPYCPLCEAWAEDFLYRHSDRDLEQPPAASGDNAEDLAHLERLEHDLIHFSDLYQVELLSLGSVIQRMREASQPAASDPQQKDTGQAAEQNTGGDA